MMLKEGQKVYCLVKNLNMLRGGKIKVLYEIVCDYYLAETEKCYICKTPSILKDFTARYSEYNKEDVFETEEEAQEKLDFLNNNNIPPSDANEGLGFKHGSHYSHLYGFGGKR